MKYLFLLLLMAAFLRSSTQTYMVKKVYTMDYAPSEVKGNYKNGSREGEWIDSTKNGTIYQISYYSNGRPTGLWKLYYPDGKLRKEIEYDSLGNVLKWKRYSNNKTEVEIISDSYFSIQLITELANFEEKLFDIETSEYIPAKESERKNREALVAALVKTIDEKYSIDINNILNILEKNSFKGKCLIYNQDSLLKSEAIYSSGKPEVKKFFYKKAKLKQMDLYIDNVLVENTTFNSDGSKKKVKKVKK